MKAKILATVAIIFSQTIHALAQGDPPKNEPKTCYMQAKLGLEAMLSGKEPLSYEKAIFLIENAFVDNRATYQGFQDIIDYGTANIRAIMGQLNDPTPKKTPEDFFDALRQKSKEDQSYLPMAQANFAIYKYMTDTTNYLDTANKVITVHWPYKYAVTDPLGSGDWNNTQATNLLLNGKGNCFALASLFKIYAERLGSGANICTAPSHIYIRHKDENGTNFNVEVASRAFPGTGTLSTLTYTTQAAIKSGISLRELDLKQSVALCLVYLAKGYEHKVNPAVDDDFMMDCATSALYFDSLNLNAMLLKAELLEKRLIASNKTIGQLQVHADFKAYEMLLSRLYTLGYREIPLPMKNNLVKGWTRDSVTSLAHKSYLAMPGKNGNQTRYASLSWGLFDEDIGDKPTERYGQTVFSTKQRKITGFAKEQTLYNNYSFDPVLFALNVDPLAKEFPSWSPYAAMGDNPIRNIDPDGRKFYNFNSSGDYIGTTHDNWFHNLFIKQGRQLDANGKVERQFRFADRKNDTKEIENGTITKLVVVTDAQLRLLVARSGGFDHDNKTENRSLGNRYDYIKAEGAGLGKMDFSYSQIPKLFSGASKDPLNVPSAMIFLPPSPMATGEYAHNQMNFGNFLFGLSGQAQGFSLGELQYGAHWRALTQDGEDGYEPQLDSNDDQFSIGKGYEYGSSYGYDKMEFKVTTSGIQLSQPSGR